MSKSHSAAVNTVATNTGQKKEANNHFKHETEQKKHDNRPAWKTYIMSGFLYAAFFALFAIPLAIAANYWSKGGLGNVKFALWWGIAAYVVLGIGLIFAYQYYVIAPASDVGKLPDVRDRPYVFFKHVSLEEPLAVGKIPAVVFIAANSGSIEAKVSFKDSTSYFSSPNQSGPPPTYSSSIENTFNLAPTAEATGRFKFPTLNLSASEIKSITEGRANLYFFARGEYRDEFGRTWQFPFCRVYSTDFPGNVINCPDSFKIENGNQSEVAPNQGLSVAERPYVQVDIIKMTTLKEGETPSGEILYTNRGLTPALDVTIVQDSAITNQPFPDNPKYVKTIKDTTKLFMAANTQRSQLVEFTFVATKDLIGQIQQGRVHLYIFGNGTYKDALGKDYSFKFCGYYAPRAGESTLTVIAICSNYNSST